jgi:hypothetical protein
MVFRERPTRADADALLKSTGWTPAEESSTSERCDEAWQKAFEGVPPRSLPSLGERPLRRWGFAFEFLEDARNLPLDSAQRATVHRLDESLAEDHTIEDELVAEDDDLISDIRANHIDESKTRSHVATLERLARARQDAEAAALNELHAVLSESQRSEVVVAVRWRRHPRRDDAGFTDADRAGLDPWPRMLGLDASQRTRLAELNRRADRTLESHYDHHEAIRTRMDALLAAFSEEDMFDARGLDLSTMPILTMGAEETITLYEGLLRLLTAQQRERLATSLREMHEFFGQSLAGSFRQAAIGGG